jgi:hypothetical protein
LYQVSDSVVDEHEAVEFLLGSVGMLRAQQEMRPSDVSLISSKVDVNSHRWAYGAASWSAGALAGSRIVVISR